MDDADFASNMEQREREAAIRNHRFPRPSSPVAPLVYCIGCGHQIPEGRLKIVPDTKHCVDCQNDEERR